MSCLNWAHWTPGPARLLAGHRRLASSLFIRSSIPTGPQALRHQCRVPGSQRRPLQPERGADTHPFVPPGPHLLRLPWLQSPAANWPSSHPSSSFLAAQLESASSASPCPRRTRALPPHTSQGGHSPSLRAKLSQDTPNLGGLLWAEPCPPKFIS